MDGAVVGDRTVPTLTAAGVAGGCGPTAAIVGDENEANLLVGTGGQGGVGTQIGKEASSGRSRKEVDLHGLGVELGRELLPAGGVVIRVGAGIGLNRANGDVDMIERAIRKGTARGIGDGH